MTETTTSRAKREQPQIRLIPEVAEELTQHAKINRRSLTSQVNLCLESWLMMSKLKSKEAR